jgi:hypothetical protein
MIFCRAGNYVAHAIESHDAGWPVIFAKPKERLITGPCLSIIRSLQRSYECELVLRISKTEVHTGSFCFILWYHQRGHDFGRDIQNELKVLLLGEGQGMGYSCSGKMDSYAERENKRKSTGLYKNKELVQTENQVSCCTISIRCCIYLHFFP